MKILVILLGVFMSFAALASRVEVDVVGMSCGMCVEAITKELTATQKAENISVKVEDKKAWFDEVKGKKISDTEIKAAIKKAGINRSAFTCNRNDPSGLFLNHRRARIVGCNRSRSFSLFRSSRRSKSKDIRIKFKI